jgi:hypothetical protein
MVLLAGRHDACYPFRYRYYTTRSIDREYTRRLFYQFQVFKAVLKAQYKFLFFSVKLRDRYARPVARGETSFPY